MVGPLFVRVLCRQTGVACLMWPLGGCIVPLHKLLSLSLQVLPSWQSGSSRHFPALQPPHPPHPVPWAAASPTPCSAHAALALWEALRGVSTPPCGHHRDCTTAAPEPLASAAWGAAWGTAGAEQSRAGLGSSEPLLGCFWGIYACALAGQLLPRALSLFFLHKGNVSG